MCLASTLSVGAWCGPPQTLLETRASTRPKDILAYDGRWWASADENERSGFIAGTGSCLDTDGLQKIFWGDYRSIDDAIGSYYKEHPKDRTLSVMEVWGKVGSTVQERKRLEGGERYRQPGGAEGDWYKRASRSERLGFLEGYLACLDTYFNDPPQTYSLAINYYDDRISKYVESKPSAEEEEVGEILSRFRDRTDGKSGMLPPIRREYPDYISPELRVRKRWRFDGHWWLDDAESPERLGFIEGAQEYLLWVAHDETFSAWPVQVVNAISAYYKIHGDDQNALVLSVWRMLAAQIPAPTSTQKRDPWRQKPKGRYLATPWFSGEKLWWQVEEDRREGFVEAYIWCELNYANQPTETYSSSSYGYQEKIGNYLRAHPKAVNQPLADLLYMFRDKTKAN